jgi:hypothetical protein
MKTTITKIIMLLGLSLSQAGFAQNLDWVKKIGGANIDLATDVTLDATGNIYTTGSFQGTVDFDPGPGVLNLTAPNGSSDIFISKLDPSGNLIWAKRIGGSQNDGGNSVAIDETLGQVIVTGYFRGTVDFDPCGGTTNVSAFGNADIFVVKLNSSGCLIWAKRIGGTSNEEGKSVYVDANRDIYITGYFSGTADFDPNAPQVNITSNGGTDIFVEKLDYAGAMYWARRMGGTGNDQGLGIAVDNSGNVHTTGLFRNTVDFFPLGGVYNLTSAGNADVFVQQLDPTGNFNWANGMGGTGDDTGRSIAVDLTGNVHVTGDFEVIASFGSTTIISNGLKDVFASKLDNSGSFQWSKSFGGASTDRGRSIAVDDSGNSYITGDFSGTSDFDPGTGTADLTSFGLTDIFIEKLDVSGNYTWTKQMGGNEDDQGNGIAVDDSGSILTAGFFKSTVDFDPEVSVFNLTSSGGRDIFIQKLSCNSTGIDVQTACDSYTWIDGNTYTASNNTATFTLTNVAGCDSIVTLDLTILNSTAGTHIQTACDSYTWIDGNTYTASTNTATFTLMNAAGCDSVVTLDLTILNSNTGTDLVTTCDSYTWIDGNTYTSSNNTATWTLTNAAGCDSVVTLDLTIGNSNTGTDIQTACDTYTWIDGNTYTASNNTATYTLTNVSGCDSIVTLDLTILNSTAGTDLQTACDTYTWIDGNTYTTSNNTATFTLVNAAGCDSVVILDLTILNSTTGTDVQSACGAYTWIDGNTYTSSNNTATWTLTNAAGCDSVVTLDLTIGNSNTGTDIQTACDTYTWIDGNTYTASNSTATWTLTNAAGCDSIVTLDLTILNSTVGTDVQTACDAYTWIDGNTYTASTNTATFTLMNAAGCDSVVTLDLTILNSTTGTDVQTTCDTYTWIDGNTYTASNNTATFTLTNAVGCDSVVTLDLTINSVSDVTTSTTGSTITANNANATYQWLDCNDGNSPINGANSATFSATQSGEYAVELTENGCVDTSSCVTISLANMTENFMGNTLSVYPNPASDLINFRTKKPIREVSVLTVEGKLIATYGSVESISVAYLNEGIFFVIGTLQDGTYFKRKFVKQ